MSAIGYNLVCREVAMAPTLFKFARRQNINGTADSICIQCFRTIGTASDLNELRIVETFHECDEDDLDRMQNPELWLMLRGVPPLDPRSN
jgi:hypothetical protein